MNQSSVFVVRLLSWTNGGELSELRSSTIMNTTVCLQIQWNNLEALDWILTATRSRTNRSQIWSPQLSQPVATVIYFVLNDPPVTQRSLWSLQPHTVGLVSAVSLNLLPWIVKPVRIRNWYFSYEKADRWLRGSETNHEIHWGEKMQLVWFVRANYTHI